MIVIKLKYPDTMNTIGVKIKREKKLKKKLERRMVNGTSGRAT